MTVKEFIKEYKEAIDMKKFVEARISREYVPYTEKITRLESLIDKTSVLSIGDGKEIFKQNSPARFLIYTLTLIDSYTDVDINFSECVEEFDSLSEENLIGALLSAIPENERKTFQMLHDMIYGDYYENNRGLVGFLDTKIEAFSIILGKFLEVMSELQEEYREVKDDER